MAEMKELVEYIAKSLVSDPDAVEVTESGGGSRNTVNLLVSPSDMGRVIGKQGRIAQAMRTLLKVAASRDGHGGQPVLIIGAVGGDTQGTVVEESAVEIDEEAVDRP